MNRNKRLSALLIGRLVVECALARFGRGVACGIVVAAGSLSPVVGAYLQDSDAPAFEVASIKRSGPIDPMRARFLEMMANDIPVGLLPGNGNRIRIDGWSAAGLIAAAYQIPMREIVGPSWIQDVRYEIDALVPSKQSRTRAPEMLQTLLKERLALKAHREVRSMAGYILSIGKGGPKLTETGQPTPSNDVGRLTGSRIRAGFKGFQLNHGSMAQLANNLSRELQAPVEDQTGLKRFYSILIEIENSEMKDELARPTLFQHALNA